MAKAKTFDARLRWPRLLVYQLAQHEGPRWMNVALEELGGTLWRPKTKEI
jgi:hypothetical protein